MMALIIADVWVLNPSGVLFRRKRSDDPSLQGLSSLGGGFYTLRVGGPELRY